MSEGGGVDDRFEQRRVGVRHGRDEFLRCGESAAGMAVPQLLRENVDEAYPVIDRALVERVRSEIAIDVVGTQVRHHFRRRYRADLYVRIGIEAVLGDVIPQQIIVHGIVERHRELEALPLLGVVLVFVLDR